MDNLRYPSKRLAEILGITEAALARAAKKHGISPVEGDAWGPSALSRFREALDLWPERQAPRRQLFLNFKGGTGKTSLSVSYAHRLAELGHRVLVIDLDSQGHATKCLGFDGDAYEGTLFEALVKKVSLRELRVETPIAQLHFVPSNLRMATVDLALMPLASREHRLRKALDEVMDEYDYVVLDAPPAFGLLNLNAIVATDDLFVPVLPDFLSFHGLKLLFETLDDVEDDLEHTLERIFIVLNQFNPVTKIARAAKDALEEHYADFLLPTVVRQCTKFAQASGEGVPIFAFDHTSKGAMDIQALIDTVGPVAPAAAREQSA